MRSDNATDTDSRDENSAPQTWRPMRSQGEALCHFGLETLPGAGQWARSSPAEVRDAARVDVPLTVAGWRRVPALPRRRSSACDEANRCRPGWTARGCRRGRRERPQLPSAVQRSPLSVPSHRYPHRRRTIRRRLCQSLGRRLRRSELAHPGMAERRGSWFDRGAARRAAGDRLVSYDAESCCTVAGRGLRRWPRERRLARRCGLMSSTIGCGSRSSMRSATSLATTA